MSETRQRAARFAFVACMLGALAAWLAKAAYAQDAHGGMNGASLSTPELLAAFAHGAAQFAVVFLVGLVVFEVLVWLPASRSSSETRGGGRALVRAAWVLVATLAVAGTVEIPVYAVRASGEDLSFGLLFEAVFGTRVGHVWLARIGLAVSVALAAAWAVRKGKSRYWLAATGLGGALLATLTAQSHAAAEARLLPFVSDWLHVSAVSVWMGGLLGFPLLLVGPLRRMEGESRQKLLGKAVRRFSATVSGAVVVISLTGIYAALLHVPDLASLVETPYGRALIMKLGLVFVMLAIGAINMFDRGSDPFSRMVGFELVLAFFVFVATGFLSTVPPPD